MSNIVERAKNMQPGERERLAQEIDAITQVLPEPWLHQGEVRAALGAAYGEIRDFARAIKHYLQALDAEDGQTTLRAIEQLCNIQVRQAQTLAPEDALRMLQEATQRLEALCTVSPTSERHSLLASAAKRQFMLTEDRETQQELLRRMQQHYRTAYKLARQAMPRGFAPYSLVNYVTVRVVLEGLPQPQESSASYGSIEALLHEAEQAGRERDQHTAEFWNAIVVPDCQVARALKDHTLCDQSQAILAAYQRAFARSGSPRERHSVIEQCAFLRRAVRLWADTAQAEQTSEGLKRLQDALPALPGHSGSLHGL